MLTKYHEGIAYSSRPENSIPCGISLDKETVGMLEKRAPGKRARSRYLTRLIHEDYARAEERARLKKLFEEDVQEEQSRG